MPNALNQAAYNIPADEVNNYGDPVVGSYSGVVYFRFELPVTSTPPTYSFDVYSLRNSKYYFLDSFSFSAGGPAYVMQTQSYPVVDRLVLTQTSPAPGGTSLEDNGVEYHVEIARSGNVI